MPSPRDVASQLKQTPEEVKYARDIEQARREGREEALSQLRYEVLTYLEKQYMDPKLQRGDKRASALLEVTRDLSTWLKNKTFR